MGYPAASVLEGSGIGADDVSKPGLVIESRQCQKVVANMMRLTGNQGIGFEVGRRLRMVDLGIFAYAMLSSRTLKDAFDLWARFAGIFGMLIRLDLAEENRDDWSLTINETAPLGFLYNFFVEEALMITLNFGMAIVGEPVSVKRLSLGYPAPSHEALYHEYFACPIEFNAERTCITFNGPSLHQPLGTNDDELNEVCQARCQLIMRQVANESPTGARLRELLLRKSSPLPSLQEAAKLLGMSPRHLRRQLEREGVSYRDIVTELRIELAKEYLGSGEFHPKEISYLLGYKDPNAFNRAFKAWTGDTVSEYRARARP